MTRQAKPVPGHMKGRDWLMTQDWSDDEIALALDTADHLKDEFLTGGTDVCETTVAEAVNFPGKLN